MGQTATPIAASASSRVFLRWRPDKQPKDCRYDLLEVTKAYELGKVFSSGS